MMEASQVASAFRVATDPASVHRRLLVTPEGVAAFDAAVCASGQCGAAVICMVKVEAQLRAKIDRLTRDLEGEECFEPPRVQASPPRPPPVDVRAKGRRRR